MRLLTVGPFSMLFGRFSKMLDVLFLNMFFLFCKLDKYYWMFFMNNDMK